MIVDEFTGSSKHSHPRVSYFRLDPIELGVGGATLGVIGQIRDKDGWWDAHRGRCAKP